MILHYVDLSDDTVRDTITLDGGELRYDTGEARSVIRSLRRRTADQSDAGVFTALAGGWSNGYVAIRSAPTVAT